MDQESLIQEQNTLPGAQAIVFPVPPPTPYTLRSAQPRCLGCDYYLTGLQQPICPECGRGFDPQDSSTYSWLPGFLFWKYWMPGLIAAIVGGILISAGFIMMEEFGLGLVLAVPISIGIVLGYGASMGKTWSIIICLYVVGSIILGLMAMDAMGMVCGAILGIIMIVPMSVGMVVGLILRNKMRNADFDQAGYLPIILLFVLPAGTLAIEKAVGFDPVPETIITTQVIDGTPQEVWAAIQFYEEVPGERPRILKIALPKPLYTHGSIDEVGDVKVCIYDKGHITKQVVAVEQYRRLQFTVIEQKGIEDRSARLLNGQFLFEPVGENQTRITLTTVYEPKLAARFIWRPFEHAISHELHEHVIRGMEYTVQCNVN